MDMATTEEMSSTMLYTSSTTQEALLTETLAPIDPIDADDPTNEDTNCDNFLYMGTLQESEDIEVTICGYKSDADNDDDSVDMVGITIQVPKNKWVAIGMRNGMYDPESSDEILNGYNIIIPLYSRDFQEVYFDGDDVDELQSSLSLFSDVYDNGMRIVRFTREAVVDYETLGGDESSDLDDTYNEKYFAFDEDFVDCDKESTFTATFANKPNTVFNIDDPISGYTNKFAKAASPSEVDGEICTDDSSANYIPILVALLTGIIALLF